MGYAVSIPQYLRLESLQKATIGNVQFYFISLFVRFWEILKDKADPEKKTNQTKRKKYLTKEKSNNIEKIMTKLSPPKKKKF